jgi:putative oxidoreductase
MDREETLRIGRLILRLIIGGLFIGHGTQKLFGWFGGPGLAGTGQMMNSLKLHPPRRNALAAGVTETAGGTLLAAGLATPVKGQLNLPAGGQEFSPLVAR